MNKDNSDTVPFDRTNIEPGVTIRCSDYVGIKCPVCSSMSLNRNKDGVEYCVICSYDQRVK